MQKSIFLTESQKQSLLKHAEQWRPNESCAILFGSIKNGQSIVKEIFLAENIDESPVNFTISNDELLKAYKMAEEKKLEIIGIFHSHPEGNAYPSATDKKFMFTNPVVWVIASGTENELKAYSLEPEIIEIPLVIA